MCGWGLSCMLVVRERHRVSPGAGSGMIDGMTRRVSCPVLVAGDAGVGKTRLVAEVLGDAGEIGAVALAGGCLDVGEGVLAYAPMVEALRPLARILDPDELERVLGGARG